jgi:4,5-dihydroxyphthalate decarboxylase
MMALPITLLTRNYAYVQPLANGDVRSDGIDLNLIRTWDALPRVAANSPDIQGGEASFGRYMLGLAAGDRSLVGLPIFIMRGFRQRCFFVRHDSPLRELADLSGTRVGINEWPASGNTWARALLREQGVDIGSIRWLVGQVSAGYKPAPNDALPVGVERQQDRMLVDMLADGNIDALVCPWPPAGFYDSGSPVRRLYPDFAPVEQAYFQRTGIYPGHHVIVLRRDLVDAHPEVVASVYSAFDEARQVTEAGFRAITEILPWLLAEIEQDTRVFGQDLHPYGVQPNRRMIEAFCAEQFAQGLTRERLDPARAFADFEQLTGATAPSPVKASAHV